MSFQRGVLFNQLEDLFVMQLIAEIDPDLSTFDIAVSFDVLGDTTPAGLFNSLLAFCKRRFANKFFANV